MQKSTALLIFAYSLLLAAIVFLLGSCLTGKQRIAFRDASHFYTPLYSYVAERQQQDWFPLWNPLDLTGIPLAGETTTAVFYPIRMVVYAIAPNFETALAWYVVVHLMIAAFSIHVAARSAGAGPLGCAVSVLVYPLSGPIFFLIYNPPFLVGAAWMPLLFAGGIRLLSKPDRYWVVATSIAMAMMILGGDPQAVIHVGLVGSVYLFVSLWRHWSGIQQLRTGSIRGLLGCAVSGAAIAAPQLAASIDWSLQSNRLSAGADVSRLDFSVPAWHWIELIIPEASGRLFPQYTRLSHVFPGDGRTWVVTLSAGLLLLVCCFYRFTAQSWRTMDLWDSLVFIGLFFSMALPFAFLGDVIPGYEAFRYPGKWTVLLALGMAVVASRQLDRLLRFPPKGVEYLCLTITTVCLMSAALLASPMRWRLVNGIEGLGYSDRFWGELQPGLAFEIVSISALKSAAIAALIWGLFRFVRRLDSSEHKIHIALAKMVPWALLGLVALEMTWIAVPQVVTVDRTEEQRILASVGGIEPGISSPHRSLRKAAVPAWPLEWNLPSEGNKRVMEVEVSQRGTRFGRWHLANSEAIFNSATSIVPRRMDLFLEAIKAYQQNEALNLKPSDWLAIQSWLGIDRELIVSASKPESVETDERLFGNGLRASYIKAVHTTDAPLFTWDSQWRSIQVTSGLSGMEMRERLGEIVNRAGLPPLVEDNETQRTREKSQPQLPRALEMTFYSPERVAFNIDSDQAGLLTLKTFQDGNWHVELTPTNSLTEVDAIESKISGAVRVDYLFMGIKIPAGRWEVEFTYLPWWLTPSLVMSGCGIVVVIWMLRKLVKRHPA
jgi:hypothetical protein